MRNLFKIVIRILPVLAVLIILYILYLNFYGDRNENNWFRFRPTALEIKTESEKANKFFESYFDSVLIQNPEIASSIGSRLNYDKWNDISEEAEANSYHFAQKTLKFLRENIRPERLDAATFLSYVILEKQLAEEIEGYKFRHLNYPVNQMHGIQSEMISFLINKHNIENENDALAYISRVEGINKKIDDLLEQLKLREKNGAILPDFLIPKIISDCKNIVKGSISALSSDKHILLDDFYKKVNQCDKIEKALKASLLEKCGNAIQNAVIPAYTKLTGYLEKLKTIAKSDAGIWKMENGEACYLFRLRQETSTNLSPDAIYELGMEEITRIHEEMKTIMKEVSFKGELNSFFEYMRNDQQFYYPNTEIGKNNYLKKAVEIIDSMRPFLPKLFSRLPKAELIVKKVESFREQSAGKAFYESPSPDGKIPGVYYVNTYNMSVVPKYSMEALAYHEGIPGHHLQLSLAQEMTELPRFRRHSTLYNAYIEGWGLYAELLPKELGFYKDPYSNFGRLSMELWRACRLVADVGIHVKKWSRSDAISFYKKNTPNSEADCTKMVDRHIVMPAQATSYKVGMLTILELREKARKKLGNEFDIKTFHDVLLNNGAVPLSILEDIVDDYIAKSN
jgi:uncharacterized protein (DUF885 family)